MKRIPVTVKGLKFLHDELDRLRFIERPRIINDISDARSHGDLKENAEYHAACEEQVFIEKRINILNSTILPITQPY